MSAFVRLVGGPLVCLVVAFLAAPSFAYDWQMVASSDGKYAIEMPGRPTQMTQKINTATGPADLHGYMIEASSREAYISSYIQYSRQIIASRSTDGHLRAAQQGTIKSFPNSRLLVDREISVGRYQGRFYILDLGDGSAYTSSIYLVGDRLYQNVAVTPKDRADSADVIKFLQSFRVYRE